MIAAAIVSEEFNKGTIKQLLVRPYSRTKILTSKIIVALIYIISLVFVVGLIDYLALLTGDFRVQGVPFTGTDGVWIANNTWNLGGNEYFGSSISDTGDMAFYNSYLVVNSQYFAIQDALHYYFNNVSRDANGSMCSILSDNTRLNAVKAWYEDLDASIVAKLAITPDHDVSVKETLDYIMFKANFVNPHASIFRMFDNNRNNYVVITIITILTGCGVAAFVFFRRKRAKI